MNQFTKKMQKLAGRYLTDTSDSAVFSEIRDIETTGVRDMASRCRGCYLEQRQRGQGDDQRSVEDNFGAMDQKRKNPAINEAFVGPTREGVTRLVTHAYSIAEGDNMSNLADCGQFQNPGPGGVAPPGPG